MDRDHFSSLYPRLVLQSVQNASLGAVNSQCGNNSAGGGVASKTYAFPQPPSAFCETKYSSQLPTQTPDSLLGPTQGGKRFAAAVI